VTPNLKAFLDMLAYSEGTILFGDQDGYNVIVGGELFDDYSDHPRKRVWIPRIKNYSTAAGRYQLLSRYFDAYAKQLGLPDFTPASQDAIAIQQIRERRALPDIEAGRLLIAVRKCRNIWASLPGAGYGQHEQRFDDLQHAYKKAGGRVAA
jgi:muramidase (phage lysozyme)